MAVVVGGCLGTKRGLFDEDPFSPPSSKRLRFAGSPARCSPAAPASEQAKFAHLLTLFPEMEPQTVAEALETAGNNIESAIERLEGLRLSCGAGAVPEETPPIAPVEGTEPCGDTTAPWTEAIVQEMSGSANIDDARRRASTLLVRFEAEVTRRATQGASENVAELKNHLQTLVRDNTILKRAVAIQNTRQQEQAGREQEVAELRQTVAQYQEQLKNAELHNYALTMHLRQAMQSVCGPAGSGPHHPPDVF